MMDGGGHIGTDAIIKLAIMAVGGQGGGVLANWITDMAVAEGWHAQSTAVAGVAQRTGATIYYIEMAPDSGQVPVFSLAPAAADIDVLIAAEWMEAGRAVMRGFVTPDRTTLIASTHRALSLAEKMVPGDGIAENAPVAEALEASAKAVIAYDMQTQALQAGSVISSSLFGALAASGALPFGREAFERTIRASGRGVEASLRAFDAGFAGPAPEREAANAEIAMSEINEPDWKKLVDATSDYSGPVREMALNGLRKVVDFQDIAYGQEYLDRLQPFLKQDEMVATAAAKYIANAMAYDDVIGVADRKTRPSRFRRIEAEMQAAPEQLRLTEFLHPRIEEICGALPIGLGRWIEERPRLMAWLDRRVNKGRRIRSDRLWGFLQLYLIAGRRPHRRKTLRHERETQHIDQWLGLVHATIKTDPTLAAEILICRRLIKGYSDTHARGQSKYDRVLGSLPMLQGREDAAAWLGRLREAALRDADGEALDGALKTVASFAGSAQKAAE